MTTRKDPERRLRVLHVYRTYFPDTQGGVEEVIQQVCLNTREHGIESRVFTLSEDPTPEVVERPEAKVIRARCHLEVASCNISLTALDAFRREAEWADVLHYHYPWPFGDVLHLAGAPVTNKPAVLTYHSDIVRQKLLGRLYSPLRERFLQRIECIVATSPNQVRSSPVLQHHRERVEVIPIGINEASYPTPDLQVAADFRKRFGERFLLFIGVLRYYKGLHLLLEAARHHDVDLVIVGKGPEAARLQRQARRLKLQRVHFLGYVDDDTKMALLSACSGLVLPSHLPSEAFGVSLLEAAMMSRPLVSCELGTGTSYVNQHNKTGRVIPPGNVWELHQAMLELIQRPGQAEEWGQAARQRFEALFTGAKMGQQYAELYHRIA